MYEMRPMTFTEQKKKNKKTTKQQKKSKRDIIITVTPEQKRKEKTRVGFSEGSQSIYNVILSCK